MCVEKISSNVTKLCVRRDYDGLSHLKMRFNVDQLRGLRSKIKNRRDEDRTNLSHSAKHGWMLTYLDEIEHEVSA